MKSCCLGFGFAVLLCVVALAQTSSQSKEGKVGGRSSVMEEEDSKEKMPVERNWRPSVGLTNVLPEVAAPCLAAMLLAGEAKPDAKVVECKEGISPVDAARLLLARIGGSADDTWIIQVVRFERKDLKDAQGIDAKKFELTLCPRPFGNRVFLYWRGQKLAEIKGRRLWGVRSVRTLLVVDALAGEITASTAALRIGEPAKTQEWREMATVALKDELEKNYNFSQWFVNRFVPFADRGGRVFAVPEDIARLTQFMASKKKDPAWLTHVLDVLGLAKFAQGAQGTELNPVRVALYGMGQMPDIPVPSDMWVQAGISIIRDADWRTVGADPNTLFTPVTGETEVDNEGKYWFDASIGLPVKKVDELEYVRADNRLQTREVAAESILGLANFIPHKIDIKDPKTTWHPRFIIGLGLRGRVLDRTFFGFGMGFALGPFKNNAILQAFQPYAGLQRTVTRVTESATGQVKSSSAWKLAIGINIPVKSAVERLAKKKEAAK
ncbi:hypothetical protein [Paludibaculum fermentans]|uniref:hypothetical protein n=1 Tax=Paludibaculum fermentans TaxID=1473598 RepID=UPI003EBDFAF8